MGELLRNHDWAATPLGPPEGWSPALCAALSICLGAQYPVALYWGPELTLIYNDYWRPIPGDKHPWALGRSGREVWPEIWHLVGPEIDDAIAGKGVWRPDSMLPLRRHGYLEETYFSYTFTPVRGEDGQIEGIFNSGLETTVRVVSERRTRLLVDLKSAASAAQTVEAVRTGCMEVLAADQADVSFAALYDLDARGDAVLAASTNLVPGSATAPLKVARDEHIWPWKQLEPGKPFLVADLAGRDDFPPSGWAEPCRQALLLPVSKPSDAEPQSVLVIGASPRHTLDADYCAFLQLIAGTLATGLANARANQEASEAMAALHRLTETLEAQVEERTRELIDANARLRQEIAERQCAEEQLRQAQKMEAVGQLTGGLAHDFNNMLTGITGALDLIRHRLAAGRSDGLEKYVTIALASAQRAASMTQRLLAFARRQPLDPKPADPRQLIRGLRGLLKQTLGPSITLKLDLDPATGAICCDVNQLESALLNLAINARDAMPDGGTLTIQSFNLNMEESEIAAFAADIPPGDYVKILVTDTGTGMTPEVIAKAFDPFFTTKPVGEGTGLGLSMLYGFIKQSGGHVRIESEVGAGTTFRLALPVYRETVETALAAADTRQASHRSHAAPATVLVVDDEEAVRFLVCEQLREAGYRVLESCNGEDGYRLLEDAGEVDLLITDIGMPRLGGRQLAEIARQRFPDLPILFISGYPFGPAAGKGVPLPVDAPILAKPFSAEALLDRVKAALA